MVRLSAFIPLLLCLVVPTTTPWAQAAKEVEVNGVRIQYLEDGSGEPVVFVHGALGDLRSWEPVREGIASKYRFVAYTQRYYGTEPWPDDGRTSAFRLTQTISLGSSRHSTPVPFISSAGPTVA